MRAGPPVRGLQVYPRIFTPGSAPGSWRVVWDGRDGSGNLVMPGVYLYRWEFRNAVTNGTIVVAR